MNATIQAGLALLTAVALKILGVIVFWFVGRWLIRFAIRIMERALNRQDFDRTLVSYIKSALGILLNVAWLFPCWASSAFRRPPSRRCWLAWAWQSERRGADFLRISQPDSSCRFCGLSRRATMSKWEE